MQSKNTRDFGLNGFKLLVYGQAGAGKTSLIPTLPRPIALSAEGGLLSIQDNAVPYIEIKTVADMTDAYLWLTQSAEADGFDSIALDSISEIAETVLANEKENAKDPRQAYGALQDIMGRMIRSFRDLNGKHVYFSAKLEKQNDEMNRILYYPAMPGNKLAQGLPYFFDEVLALRVEKAPDGGVFRTLMTESDGLWLAKDRSGKLGPWEAPHLGQIIEKINYKEVAA